MRSTLGVRAPVHGRAGRVRSTPAARTSSRSSRDSMPRTRATTMLDLRPRRFKLVVFDWDGTLSDSTAIIAQAIQGACRDMGEPVPDDQAARYRDRSGPRRRHAHRCADAARTQACRAGRALSRSLSRTRGRHSAVRRCARACWTSLRRRHLLAVATGKTRARTRSRAPEATESRDASMPPVAPTKACRSLIRTCCCI